MPHLPELQGGFSAGPIASCTATLPEPKLVTESAAPAVRMDNELVTVHLH